MWIRLDSRHQIAQIVRMQQRVYRGRLSEARKDDGLAGAPHNQEAVHAVRHEFVGGVEAVLEACTVTRPTRFFVAFHDELRGASGRGCADRRWAAPACSRVHMCRCVERLTPDCSAVNEIRAREPIRCRECGHRIMYKKRTKNMARTLYSHPAAFRGAVAVRSIKSI